MKATIEVFKAQVKAHGWDWAQRDEFGFICFDRWLVKKGNSYMLNMGNNKGQMIDNVDRSYLEWIVDKCVFTDDQTRDIINPYIGRYVSPTLPTSRGKKRSKGIITDADLSLF